MAITIDNNYQINENLRPGYNAQGAVLSGAVPNSDRGDALSAGTTVTGQIVEKDGDQVTIRLGNDRTISAKMQGNADIEVGSTMTFEVAKGSGGQTALRPLYSNLSAGSATLSALKAAGLPVNDTTIAMTDRMMSESMPVNRNALVEMFRNISAHQNASCETIVSMTKLGMPLTETNVIQYENYRNFEHQITNDLQATTSGVAEMFHEAAQSGDTAVINEVLNLIDPENLETIVPEEQSMAQAGNATTVDGAAANTAVQNTDTVQIDTAQVNTETAAAAQAPETASEAENKTAVEVANETAAEAPPHTVGSAANAIRSTVDSFIGELREMILPGSDAANEQAVAVNTNLSLTGAEQMSLSTDLQNILILAGESADIHEPLDPSQVMTAVKQLVQDYPPEVSKVTEVELAPYSEEASEGSDEANLMSQERSDIDMLAARAQGQEIPEAAENVKEQISAKLADLIKSDGFTKLVKDTLNAQMSIRPKDVAQPGKIEELYDRIQKTTARITEMMETLGRGDSAVSKAAASLNENVNFMNNLNEFVGYVQLPLKMAGEDANGELYVYTRKKDLSNKDGNYSALLHLDMEHLGPMDVYVTMRDHTKVNTTFYLASEKLLDFIEAHIDELTKRLTEKGYDTGIRVTKKEPGSGIMTVAEEFTKEEPHEGAHMVVSKMRFDVRA